jgi:hypothetical protein
MKFSLDDIAVTGVLASQPDSRDIKIAQANLLYCGHVLVEDASVCSLFCICFDCCIYCFVDIRIDVITGGKLAFVFFRLCRFEMLPRINSSSPQMFSNHIYCFSLLSSMFV